MRRVPFSSLSCGTIYSDGTSLPTPAAGSSAMVYNHDPSSSVWGGSRTPVAATVYAAETGSTTLSLPLIADVNGQLLGWIEQGIDLDVVATVAQRASNPSMAHPVRSDALVPITRPESYGAGYNGAASDDWGPAWTQAWADAQTIGGMVRGSARVYGLRTEIQPPTVPSGAALAPMIGMPGRGTMLQKLADTTLLNWSGPGISGSTNNYYQGSRLSNIWFDGGSNTAWTQPLVVFNSVVDHECQWLRFQNNYGPAFTMRGCWDWRWYTTSVVSCGATDGVNSAILLYSNAGDALNSTNNQWFDMLRIEDWRTGGLWVIGASGTDVIGLTKIHKLKLENSNSNPMWGPAVKLTNAQSYKQAMAQVTLTGTPGSGQTTPLDAGYLITTSANVDLGDMFVYFGGAGSSAATNVTGIIGVSGSCPGFSYDDIELHFSDAFPPAGVFHWIGGNFVYAVRRGTVRTSTGTQPTLDNGTLNLGSTLDFASFRQQTPSGVTSGFTAGAGTAMNSASVSTGGIGSTALTFGDVVAILKSIGASKQ